MLAGSCLGSCVLSIGVLEFPKIEIKEKPPKIFHTKFMELVLDHQGGSREDRKVLPRDLKAGSALPLGTQRAVAGFLEVVGFSKEAAFLCPCVAW